MSRIEFFIMVWGLCSVCILLINMFGLFNHNRISPSEYYGDWSGMLLVGCITIFFMLLSPLMLLIFLCDYFVPKIGEFLFKERGT